jgi:serine phosphatase RsbU (regulator of sigma subunit)/CheY-like chemotaxis protein
MTEPAATVLVVDDSRTRQYVFGRWLRRAGMTPVEAATGGEALSMLETTPVDVIVLDVQLPDMSGFDVCERIKADPRHAAVPVVQVSAHAIEVVDRTQGLNRGADAYLAEPIEPDELLATIHAVLRYFRARQRAERLAGRLATLADTTLAINQARGYGELLTAAALGAEEMFGDIAAASACRPDGNRLIAVARADDRTSPAPGLSAGAKPGRGSPVSTSWVGGTPPGLGDTPVGVTVVTAPAGLWSTVLDCPPEGGVTVAATRVREGRPVCFVVVCTDGLDDADTNALRQLSQAMTLAVEAMRVHDEERHLALTLQRSLLPRRLPQVPGFDFSVRYEPASSHAEIGGDFYELAMVDGKLVVAIGDVVGHSLHAATVMAELRHALRAYVSEGHGPAAVLAELNRLMIRLLPDEIATVCLLLVDPVTGQVRAACGGHLPPLLVFEGKAAPVQLAGPLLGVQIERPDDVTFDLPPGGVLVLLTDGLVERSDRSFEVGLAQVLEAAASIEPDLERFCDRLLVELDAARSEDDIALVVLRRRP